MKPQLKSKQQERGKHLCPSCQRHLGCVDEIRTSGKRILACTRYRPAQPHQRKPVKVAPPVRTVNPKTGRITYVMTDKMVADSLKQKVAEARRRLKMKTLLHILAYCSLPLLIGVAHAQEMNHVKSVPCIDIIDEDIIVHRVSGETKFTTRPLLLCGENSANYFQDGKQVFAWTGEDSGVTCLKCLSRMHKGKAWIQSVDIPLLYFKSDYSKIRIYTGAPKDYVEFQVSCHGTATPEKAMRMLKPYIKTP